MSYCDYWANCDEAEREYHDREWGTPLHDDVGQFEFLMLEALQCGLSWKTVFKKREIFRRYFAGFDFARVAKFDESDEARILVQPGMLRSPRKIRAVIANARAFCAIRAEFGSFSEYIWSYTDGVTLLYDGHADGTRMPVSNALSEKIAKDLKKRGFKFLGAVSVYAHLQACGIINDHSQTCPRYTQIIENFPCKHCATDGERY